MLHFVELRRGQARAVDRDRVADVAVVEDGGGVGNGERAATRVALDGGDGAEVLDLLSCAGQTQCTTIVARCIPDL